MSAARRPNDSEVAGETVRDKASIDDLLHIPVALTHFTHWIVLTAALATVMWGSKWILGDEAAPGGPGPSRGFFAALASAAAGATSPAATATAERQAGGTATPSASAEGAGASIDGGATGRAARGRLAVDGRHEGGTNTDTFSVVIESTPPAARLILDGLEADDSTPLAVALREGAQVRLEAAGFQPFEWQVSRDELRDERDGARTLHFSLTPKRSSVERLRVPQFLPYPKRIREVDPVYPVAERRAGVRGIVILTLEIDAEGNVIDVEILRRVSAALDEAAVYAAWQWKFEPTIYKGVAVSVVGNFSVPFSLH